MSITRTCIILLIMLGSIASVQAATLQATVDRNQMSMNETLRLTVRYDQQVESSLLNLDALDADFEVLAVSPQSSSSMSIVNGQPTRTEATVWTIVLAPKKSGNLTIPAFSINGNSSQAFQISVGKGSASNASAAPLLVAISADNPSIYPAQQLIIEVELSAASDVRDLNGPQLIINNAEIENLGQQSFQRVDNGVARQIVVLKYAVFTDQPGKLIIPVMTYTGVKGGSRSFFGTRGQQVIARSKQFEIEVLPAETKANSAWLPAKKLEIQSSLSADGTQLKVGEPITRTITITAHGQRASAIPPLAESASSSQYKSYKDQPQLDTQTQADGLVGRRIESEAIVPAQEGELVLPETRLSWWDVKAKHWQEAVLPAETLQVKGIANTAAAPQPASIATQPNTVSDSTNRLWQMLTALLALICLTQFWWIVRSRNHTSNSDTPTEDPTEKKAWKELQQALKQQDAKAIRQSLIRWAQLTMPPHAAINLRSIAQHYPSDELKTQLTNLETRLYKDSGSFDAQKLSTALDSLKAQLDQDRKRNTESNSNLKPLYR